MRRWETREEEETSRPHPVPRDSTHFLKSNLFCSEPTGHHPPKTTLPNAITHKTFISSNCFSANITMNKNIRIIQLKYTVAIQNNRGMKPNKERRDLSRYRMFWHAFVEPCWACWLKLCWWQNENNNNVWMSNVKPDGDRATFSVDFRHLTENCN